MTVGVFFFAQLDPQRVSAGYIGKEGPCLHYVNSAHWNRGNASTSACTSRTIEPQFGAFGMVWPRQRKKARTVGQAVHCFNSEGNNFVHCLENCLNSI